MTRRRFLILVGILFLAFLLRLIMANSRPLWYDDTFEIFLAEKDLPAIASGAVADTMPPLYYILLHYWMPLVGQTPLALRMLSVALSMLVVALAYLVAARGSGWRAGIWAALFAALAPFQIYHAQDLRMYAVLALALMLYIYGCLRLLTRARHALILISISTAVALYSHNLAAITLIAVNVYFVWRRDWRAHVQLIAAQGIGGLLFVPWLLYIPEQIAKIQRAFWTQPPGLVEVLQMLMVFDTYLPLPGILLTAALFITLAVFAIAALELLKLFRRGAPNALGLMLAFAAVPPMLMFGFSYLMRPIFIPRGVIASALAYYVLLAVLASRARRFGYVVIAAVVGVISLSSLPFLYSAWGEWRRAPFAEADRYLRAQIRTGDLILHDNKLSYFPMRFYDRELPQEFIADPAGTSNDTLAPATAEAMGIAPVELGSAIRGQSRVWFVIFQTAIDEAAQAGEVQGNLSPLDVAMRREDSASFGDLRIIRYEAR